MLLLHDRVAEVLSQAAHDAGDVLRRCTMARFRKRPVEIEAEQWWPGKFVEGVTELVHDPGDGSTVSSRAGVIDTLEGPHIVSPGDWVITGVKGEKYACKPDVFAATYEPVDDAGEG